MMTLALVVEWLGGMTVVDTHYHAAMLGLVACCVASDQGWLR